MAKLNITTALVFLSFLGINYLVNGGKPWEPEARTEDWWIEQHAELVNISRYNSSSVKIMFTGSSSIERWSTTGKDIFDANYVPLGAVNYGLGGDKIQHLLYRIQDGELDNISPEMVVVYIGSNNIPDDVTEEEILQGLTTLMDEFSEKLPNSKVFYLNFNPRGDLTPVNATWERTLSINSEALKLHDGKMRFVFDMFDNFIESWGQIKEQLYETDKLHMNEDGYAEWDRVWMPAFLDALNSNNTEPTTTATDEPTTTATDEPTTTTTTEEPTNTTTTEKPTTGEGGGGAAGKVGVSQFWISLCALIVGTFYLRS